MSADDERAQRDVCDALAAALRAMASDDRAGAEEVLRQVPAEDLAGVAVMLIFMFAIGHDCVEGLTSMLADFGQGDLAAIPWWHPIRVRPQAEDPRERGEQ